MWSLLKADGHQVAAVGRREEFFLLLVEKSGEGAGASAAREHRSKANERNKEVLR